jgi:molybdopterin-guanine dinucleotide biosynthesis protein A
MTEQRPLTAIVLVGGGSRRFGRDKASEVVAGRSLLQRVVDAVAPLASDIVVVGARGAAFPAVAGDLPVRCVEDAREGTGALGGLYTGLLAASHEEVVALACDMPLLSRPLLRFLWGLLDEAHDVVMPVWQGRNEPLHAFYRRSCAAAVERVLDRGGRRFVELLAEVRVRYVAEGEMAALDPEGRSFWNVNSGEELERILPLLEGEAR